MSIKTHHFTISVCFYSYRHVFWAIGTSATVGNNMMFNGNILAQTSITFNSNSNIVGRGLAEVGVTFASGTGSDASNSQTIGIPVDLPVLVATALRGPVAV